MNYTWNHTRRFNAVSNYIKNTFGSRVQKVAVDAGFSCPNRDGTKGKKGCFFCNNDAFNPSYCNPEKSITQQIKEGIEFHDKRYRRAKKYLVYFQAFTNTYDDLDILRKKYSEALEYKDVIGLVIGTRPDCISDELLNYLKELSENYYIVIEYGIESVYNKTLKRVNRGHTFEETKEAIKKTADYGLKAGGHIIFGLPGETKEEMLASADVISDLPLHSIKFHQLQILKGTRVAEDFQNCFENFKIFDLEEYLEFVVDYMERLNPEIIIERIAAETQPWYNMEINWDLRYDQVLMKMEKLMEERNTWQGKLYRIKN